MQGQIIRLQGEFTDNTLPRFYAEDPILCKGSILLVDPSNTSYPMSSGVSNGQIVPNIARKIASGIIGVAESETDALMVVGTGNAGKVLMERTAKGGIHGIVTQDKTKITSAQIGANILFTQGTHALLQYIKSNISNHNFYFSQWTVPTRAGALRDSTKSPNVYPGYGLGIYGPSAFGNDNILYNRTVDQVGVTGTNNRVSPGFNSLAENGLALAPQFRSQSRKGYSGTLPNIAEMRGAQWGRSGDALNGYPSTFPAYPSYILYRLYIEDLDVSQRTYVEVDALDYAMFQDAFALGGRLYEDAFTDPATLA